MRALLALTVCLVLSSTIIAQSKFQLAPPLLQYGSSFGAGPVTMTFNQPGASIHYTLNGEEPGDADPVYKEPITIKGNRVTLKARTLGEGFIASETMRVDFVNGGKAIDSISFTPPHKSYKNSKSDILNDGIGGVPKYGNGSWLGYDADTIEVVIQLKEKTNVGSVLIDLLQDENSWIFLPREISLSYFESKSGAYEEISYEQIPEAQFPSKRCTLHELRTSKKIKTDRLKLTFFATKQIPDWHAGKGSHAWFFIDEIKVF